MRNVTSIISSLVLVAASTTVFGDGPTPASNPWKEWTVTVVTSHWQSGKYLVNINHTDGSIPTITGSDGASIALAQSCEKYALLALTNSKIAFYQKGPGPGTQNCAIGIKGGESPSF